MRPWTRGAFLVGTALSCLAAAGCEPATPANAQPRVIEAPRLVAETAAVVTAPAAPTMELDPESALAAPDGTIGTEPAIFGVDVPLYDPSGVAMRAFHTGLRRAATGEGQARVVVYGASHVAGDFATGTLRRMLQQQFGDAGHGFVLPAQPWPHYRHLDVEVESNYRLWEPERVRTGVTAPGTYGLAGVSVTSSSSRAFGRVSTGERSASRFELYFQKRPDGGSIEVRVDGRVVRRVSTRGAEVGPDYALFTTTDAPHTFEIRSRGDGPVTVYGVSVEREVPGVILDTLGINGARAAGQLMWDEALWREHVRRRSPDLVVLAYGTNESGDDDQPIATYERELRQVVARVRAAVPDASCLLVGPSDRPVVNRDGSFAERPRTAMVIDAQRRIAADHGCGFFDLVGFGGGPMHLVQWAASDPAWAQRDHVHYTYRGYERLGQVLHGSLMTGYDGPLAAGAPAIVSTGSVATR